MEKNIVWVVAEETALWIGAVIWFLYDETKNFIEKRILDIKDE